MIELFGVPVKFLITYNSKRKKRYIIFIDN